MQFYGVLGFDILLKPFLKLNYKFNYKWLMKRIYAAPYKLFYNSSKKRPKFIDALLRMAFLIITIIFAIPTLLVYTIIYVVVSLLTSLIVLITTILFGLFYGCIPFLIKIKKPIHFSLTKINKNDFKGHNVLRLPITWMINFIKTSYKFFIYYSTLPYKKLKELYHDPEIYNFVEQIIYGFSLLFSIPLYLFLFFIVAGLINSLILILICILFGSLYIVINFLYILFASDEKINCDIDRKDNGDCNNSGLTKYIEEECNKDNQTVQDKDGAK